MHCQRKAHRLPEELAPGIRPRSGQASGSSCQLPGGTEDRGALWVVFCRWSQPSPSCWKLHEANGVPSQIACKEKKGSRDTSRLKETLKMHLLFFNRQVWTIISRNTYLREKVLQKNDYWGFPGSSVVRHLPANAEDGGSIPDPGGSHVVKNSEVHVSQLLGLCSRARGANQERPPK